MSVNPDSIMKVTCWGTMKNKSHVLDLLGILSRGTLTPTVLKSLKFPAATDLMLFALGVRKDTKLSTPRANRIFAAVAAEANELAAKNGHPLHKPLLTAAGEIAWGDIGCYALRGPDVSGHSFPVIEDLLRGHVYQAPSWVTPSNLGSWQIIRNLSQDDATLTDGNYTKRLRPWLFLQEALAPGLRAQGSAVPGQSTPDTRRPMAFSPLTGENKLSMKRRPPIPKQRDEKRSRH